MGCKIKMSVARTESNSGYKDLLKLRPKEILYTYAWYLEGLLCMALGKHFNGCSGPAGRDHSPPRRNTLHTHTHTHTHEHGHQWW